MPSGHMPAKPPVSELEPQSWLTRAKCSSAGMVGPAAMNDHRAGIADEDDGSVKSHTRGRLSSAEAGL